MDRQIQQAAEIFRQQGASDEQAMYLAQQNVNLQNAQSGANQTAFGANLGAQQQQYGQGLSSAELRLHQQAQQYQQALQGRQQATMEEQLANLFRRQPLEDLFRLWQQQAGPTGPTQGSSGVMGILGPLLGAGLSFLPGAFGGGGAAGNAAGDIAAAI
jgi:Amino acid permeases